jgi:ssDNA-binding Zn-finger/Zn-ribbon topoisomerase 1
MLNVKHNEARKVDGHWTGVYLYRCGHEASFHVKAGTQNKDGAYTIGKMRKVIRTETGMDCPDCRAKAKIAVAERVERKGK